ncbi:hypothetical protein AAMO2058_001257100 [Amorphochlora amoebiformis]
MSSSEHEGSKRMKTELLVQMDGLAKTDDRVFVLAASNLPWALDPAMLRRLEKRILVQLPSREARKFIIQHQLSDGHRANYSGSDIMLMCKEAAMRPMRQLMRDLEKLEAKSSEHDLALMGKEDVDVKLRPVNKDDIAMALKCTKPSTKISHLKKYEAWHEKHGSGVSAGRDIDE